MIAVALMADRADRKDDLQIRVHTFQQLQEHLPLVNDVVGVQAFAHKKVVRLFMAVGNQHARLLQPINDGCSQRDNQHIRATQKVCHTMGGAVDSFNHRCHIGRGETAVM